MPDESTNSVLHHVRKLFAAVPRDGPADAELLGRFTRDADEAAFELIVWRHAEMVLSACRHLLGDRHDAEDAFQATFLVLFRKAGSVRSAEALAGWLHRVACRVARRARPRRAASDAGLDALPAPPPTGLDGESARALHEEISHLPAYYRAVVVCCFLEGHTHDEAARVLGWSKGTVAGRLARAKDILRRRLTRRGLAPAAALAAASTATAEALAARVGALMTGLRAAEGAAGLSPRVVLLAEGVMSMFSAKTKGAALALLGVALLGLGLALGMGRDGDREVPPDKEVAKDKGAKPKADPLAEALRRAEARKHLRQVAAAIREYERKNGHLPLPAITDEEGKPLLSWRVAILPYLGEEALYKRFKLDEAWDSDHNKKLIDKMPAAFTAVSAKAARGETNYQYVVGPTALFTSPRVRRDPKGPRSRRVDTDGKPLPTSRGDHVRGGAGILTATTLLVVEASQPVPWTKPADVGYDPKKPIEFGGAFPASFHALFVDLRGVVAVSRRLEPDTLRKLIAARVEKDLPPRLFSGAVIGGESPLLQSHIKRLAEQNQRLKDEAAALTELLKELRDEAKALRWANETEAAVKADPETGPLLKANARLEKAIQEARDEAKKLIAEVERLKKGK